MARPRKTNSRKPSQKKKDCVTCGDVDFMKNVTKRGRKPKAAAHKTSVTASMTFERNNNVLHFDQLSLTTFPSLPEERFDLVNSCVQKNRSETRLNVVEFNGDIVQQSLPLMMGPMESVFHQQHRIAAGCSVMPSQTTPTGRCSNWDLHEFIECVYSDDNSSTDSQSETESKIVCQATATGTPVSMHPLGSIDSLRTTPMISNIRTLSDAALDAYAMYLDAFPLPMLCELDVQEGLEGLE